jgi:hypothetical protein
MPVTVSCGELRRASGRPCGRLTDMKVVLVPSQGRGIMFNQLYTRRRGSEFLTLGPVHTVPLQSSPLNILNRMKCRIIRGVLVVMRHSALDFTVLS